MSVAAGQYILLAYATHARSCVLLIDGTASCSGSNDFGQFGRGNNASSLTFVDALTVGLPIGSMIQLRLLIDNRIFIVSFVCLLTFCSQINQLWSSSCVFNANNRCCLLCWVISQRCFLPCIEVNSAIRQNDEGQLGDGSSSTNFTLVNVLLPRGTNASAISAGNDHACAIANAGTNVYCWVRFLVSVFLRF